MCMRWRIAENSAITQGISVNHDGVNRNITKHAMEGNAIGYDTVRMNQLPSSYNRWCHWHTRQAHTKKRQTDDDDNRLASTRTFKNSNLPEWSRNTVLPSNVGWLKKCSSPCPLRNNHTSSKTSLDHTSSGAVQVDKIRRQRRGWCVSIPYSRWDDVYGTSKNKMTILIIELTWNVPKWFHLWHQNTDSKRRGW